ncbi:hypothetical protein [Hyalangium gracile]|uniref:hypothetical protein n=1 Tax=Hyalangium gracile TaxID=394092 RepID=UPI001CCC433D|nr:hypothetical protein [Hyalangium gracile]
MNTSWRPLYRAGAVAAIAVLALVPFQIAIYVLWPPPDTVEGWFALFRAHSFIALVDMDLLLMVDNVLLGLMFLALYVALREVSPTWMTVAVSAELVAITTYLGSNTAFELLALSKQYAAAATEQERLMALAAGQAMIATWQGSAFNVSYVLGAIVILITATVMLRSQVFGKATALTGLVFGALSVVPASAGKLGIVLSLLSLVPMWLWLLLIARRLFQLAHGVEHTGSSSRRRGVPSGDSGPAPERRLPLGAS